jgi:hypothetical protein
MVPYEAVQNIRVSFWRDIFCVVLARYLLCRRGVIQLSRVGEDRMLLAPLAGAALVMSIATSPALEPQALGTQMTTQQKNAAMQSLVRSTTECIVQAVAGDPRFGKNPPSDLGDLITDSIPACIGSVRAMIDGYDRYFGEGTGEAFFMGPYLDVLPAMVSKWTEGAAQ